MNLTIELIFICSGDDGLSSLANQYPGMTHYIRRAYFPIIFNKAIREQVSQIVNKLKKANNVHLAGKSIKNKFVMIGRAALDILLPFSTNQMMIYM